MLGTQSETKVVTVGETDMTVVVMMLVLDNGGESLRAHPDAVLT